MPILFQYLVKLSCSISVVYLFYALVLRRLTFYRCNRRYLLCFSALCFLIPAINIASLMDERQLNSSGVVQMIPTIDNYAITGDAMVQKLVSSSLSIWDRCCIVLVSGSLLLIVRLIVQYISYRSIRKKAQLLTGGVINIYGVSEPIIPFSFGSAIFINQQQHSEAELKEIMRHEFVHVKQRHTIDIIWAEAVCILNWYNPFAWLLRHALRQNLEFIADRHVIQSGANKRDYQYLLLKVLGAPQFHIVNQFNFSSLKKRIIMINKLPSAKAHLIKFLLALPLIAVLLIAFRNSAANALPEQNGNETIIISGLVLDGNRNKELQPLEGVSVHEKLSGTTALTDQRGYFSLTVPAIQFPVQTELLFKRAGFNEFTSKTNIVSRTKNSLGLTSIVMMAAGAIPGSDPGTCNVSLDERNSQDGINGGYEAAQKKAEKLKADIATQGELQKLSENSEKPYWVIDGNSFILGKGGSSAGTFTLTNIVFVDGKKMTGEEVNNTIQRSSIKTVGAMDGEAAIKKYGLNQPVLEIYTHTRPERDTIAPQEPTKPILADTTQLPKEVRAFYKRNPMVDKLYWRGDFIFIRLKSGDIERYARDKRDLDKLEKKYGKIPVAPPPPPPFAKPEMLPPPPVMSNEKAVSMQKIEFLQMKLAHLNDSMRYSNNKEEAEKVRSYLQQKMLVVQKEQKELQNHIKVHQSSLHMEQQKAAHKTLQKK